jgi:hypothetical protein
MAAIVVSAWAGRMSQDAAAVKKRERVVRKT